MAINGVTYNTVQGNTAVSKNATMVSKDDFLKILVTQLKYQNPLEPQKPEQFLTQLSQLTQVEQLQNMTNALESMKKSMEQSNISQWISTVGKKMKVDSSILSKGDEVYLKPNGDFDEIVITKTNLNTGSTETETLKKGDPLVYKHEGNESVAITVTATKSKKTVGCTANVYRVISGVNVEQGVPLLVAGNGDQYTVDKIKEIQ
ncbi:MAG TPA: flagellar hook capping FlgD N-terminal domain-containing protein [Syntrophorhabdaceae bacterium]|nr:flagellar hook capping FlgD N-terminal domain-containing protein [Syntrophorhabdaceae bacterium]